MDMFSRSHAIEQDAADPLSSLRKEFRIPSKSDLARTTLETPSLSDQPNTHTSTSSSVAEEEECTYLCGNSLGLQPLRTQSYFSTYLHTWATKGVYGHFKPLSDSPLPPWVDVDDDVKADMAGIVGAKEGGGEVAVMQTLTMNLHAMMSSFYRPTRDEEGGGRWKILLEGKAFPSDHYAIESQIRHHNLSPSDAMILIEPPSSLSSTSPILPTDHILATIDAHVSNTALLLLPGIQFYTGQLFDIPRITAYAQSKGIIVGWDLAHAVGNVPLKLHEWNVDFAVWCTYKYLNCGPGAIGGCFVHERHSQVQHSEDGTPVYRNRLSGWWGSSKASRFAMTNVFEPIPGAAGWQVSNPSVADLTAVRASLDVFKLASMERLRERSLRLTGYLEKLLDGLGEQQDRDGGRCFSIITPRNPEERGAQLSVLLKPGLLDVVLEVLEEYSVVIDERRPDVIRVAPAPLYNSFLDCFNFVEVFQIACRKALSGEVPNGHSIAADGGVESKGWSEVK